MYDNEEEIKRKRRNLLIIIGVVVLLIILLLVFIFSRGSGNNRKEEPKNKNLECKLEIKNGIKPNANNIYSEQVEVGFASVEKISDAAEHEISFERIGKTENDAYKKAKKNQNYKIQVSGEFHLTGYVEDKSGNSGTCEIVVKVNISNPECELEVKSGKLGDNDFYTSDVEVGFKSMSSNSDTTSIVKYYIEKEAIDLDTNKILRADPPKDNVEKYTVTENQTTSLIGYVIDSSGNEGSCSITINKDSEKPTCKLKVTSGKLTDGVYKDEPIVGFEDVTDKVSDVAAKGVGTTKNYSQETFAVTTGGTTKVYGYVKDNAGNENTCSIDIKRPSSEPTTPSNTSNPSCTIKLAGTSTGNNSYIGQVEAILSTSTTNGAKVTQYGIAENQTLNGKTKISITNAGSHSVYGMVKDSYGNVGYCNISFNIKNGKLLSSVVKPGQYINYDAGVWTTTSTTEVKQDGFSWGYRSGQSKNNSGLKCFELDYAKDSNNKVIEAPSGWIVLSVTDGKVVLVHAGVPECMYHDGTTQANAFLPKLKSRANEYLNSNYAESASILSSTSPGINGCEDGNTVDKTNYKFHLIGRHYFLATAKSGVSVCGVRPSGKVTGYSYRSYGVRPVVVLKSTILTTGGNGSSSSPWIISN